MVLCFIPSTIYAQNECHAYQEKPDTLTFTVYGIDCPGCAGGLEKQVNKIPAVAFSEANWVEQELKVVVKQDSTLSMDALEKRVNKANMTLDTNAKKKEGEYEK